jgi:hypothetical protein
MFWWITGYLIGSDILFCKYVLAIKKTHRNFEPVGAENIENVRINLRLDTRM